MLQFALQFWADIPSSIKYHEMTDFDEKKPLLAGPKNENICVEEIAVSKQGENNRNQGTRALISVETRLHHVMMLQYQFIIVQAM